MFVSFALQFDMESKEAKLAKLNIELEDVKKQIKEIESIPYATRSAEDKKSYNLLLEEKMSLKADIKALEGLLLFIVSPSQNSAVKE